MDCFDIRCCCCYFFLYFFLYFCFVLSHPYHTILSPFSFLFLALQAGRRISALEADLAKAINEAESSKATVASLTAKLSAATAAAAAATAANAATPSSSSSTSAASASAAEEALRQEVASLRAELDKNVEVVSKLTLKCEKHKTMRASYTKYAEEIQQRILKVRHNYCLYLLVLQFDHGFSNLSFSQFHLNFLIDVLRYSHLPVWLLPFILVVFFPFFFM